MNNIKRFRKFLLAGLSLCCCLPSYAHALDNPDAPSVLTLKLNQQTAQVRGNAVTLETNPILQNGVTMVPLRFIAEALGSRVTWDELTKTVTLQKDATTIQLTLAHSEARVNGVSLPLEQPATIINETTLVPLRFISESLQQTVTYDNNSQVITITSIKKSSPVPVPAKKKLSRPTVDNLTERDTQYSTIPIVTGNTISHRAAKEFLDLTVDNNDNVYTLDFSRNRSSATGHLISMYRSAEGKQLNPHIMLTEKFNLNYTTKKNGESKLLYFELNPQRLYYDELKDKVYTYANVTQPGISSESVSFAFFEVVPEVKLITYSKEEDIFGEFNFFSTSSDGKVYYSNSYQNKVYTVGKDQAVTTSFMPREAKLSQLVSTVWEGQTYLLDKANKRILRIQPNDTITQVATVSLEEILEASARDGSFYVHDHQGFYRIDIHGKVEPYVMLDQLAYQRGLWNPGTDSYDDTEPQNADKPLFMSNSMEISLTSPTKFSMDTHGNIILFDNNRHMLRRINLYEK
jgi:hypothetical protein